MDELDDYRSSEDEDYVASGGESEDEYEFGGPDAAPGVRGKKRRSKALGGGLSARGAGFLQAKKPRKGGVGAAVLSDDDDDMPMPQPARAAPAAPAHAATAAASTAAAAASPATAVASSPLPSTGASAEARDAASTTTTTNAAESVASPASAAPATSPPPAAAPVSSSNGGRPSLADLLGRSSKSTPTAPATAASPSAPSSASSPAPPSAPAAPAAKPPSRLALLLAKTAPKASPPPSSSDSLSDDKIVVKELTSFAGESMEITRTLLKGSVAEKAFRSQRADPLAALVASLSAKKNMSTLDKSRVDWDVSKAEEGDQDELEAAAKSSKSYVQQQQFLAQTDARQFEREKAAREVKRREAARAAANGGKSAGFDEEEAYARQPTDREADAFEASAPTEETTADAPQ